MLEKYKKKRNFQKTKEPRAKLEKLDSSALPIFVIQKHAARRLHYDFRIEAGGVLKSWAVPKGIPTKGGEKRLAVMVEDHPYDYKNFEGIIPKGNYGAGTVMVWDKGVYATYDNQKKKKIESEIKTGIKKGKITLLIKGEKMKGEFTLVRSPKMDKNAWLMIKKNDKFSGQKIKGENKSAKSGKTMEEIGKANRNRENRWDRRDIKTVSGAIKKKMPESIHPMLATPYGASFDDQDWIFEIKWDGYRAVSFLKKGRVEIRSRNEKDYNNKFHPVYEDLIKINEDMILDGEIVAINSKGLSSFSWLQDWENIEKGQLVYYVFDILYLDGYDLRSVSQVERKDILKSVLTETTHVRYVDHIEKDGKKFFSMATKKGIEGIIAKNKNSQYQSGKRSHDWLKIKAQNTEEAVIGGWTEPKGARKNLGALVLGVYKNHKLIYVGHTGGGFNEKSLKDMKQKLVKLETDRCPFQKKPKTNAPVHWVKPKLVAQVKFSEWTNDGIMRQPIFLGLREDKDRSEIIGN